MMMMMFSGASRKEVMAWRWVLWGEDLFANTMIAAHNYLLRPLLLFQRAPMQYMHREKPLNLAEIMDLLFKVHGHQILMDGCFNGDREYYYYYYY